MTASLASAKPIFRALPDRWAAFLCGFPSKFACPSLPALELPAVARRDVSTGQIFSRHTRSAVDVPRRRGVSKARDPGYSQLFKI